MKEHLSDFSPHYACLCVTLREKSSEQKREGVESRMPGWVIECLHLISVTGHLFVVRSMSSDVGLRYND